MPAQSNGYVDFFHTDHSFAPVNWGERAVLWKQWYCVIEELHTSSSGKLLSNRTCQITVDNFFQFFEQS
jgi:hypothetical protein